MIFDRIELSILSRLEPVRALMAPSDILVRGLPDDPRRAVKDDRGDIVAYVKGGDSSNAAIQIQILLPTRIETQKGCFPILERILGLLWHFTPQGALSPFKTLIWTLKIEGDRWLISIDSKVSISLDSLTIVAQEPIDTISDISISSSVGDAAKDIIPVPGSL